MFTHQSRDALRRGYSFSPLHLSTPAVPYLLYFLLLVVLPLINQWLMSFFEAPTAIEEKPKNRINGDCDVKPRKHRQPVLTV